jgi:hypothetical protein
MPAPPTLTVPFVDVSHWQKVIDWQKLAATGIKGAWVRTCMPPGKTDLTGIPNLAGARAAGVPFTGVYVVPRSGVLPEMVVDTILKAEADPRIGRIEHVMLDLEPNADFWGVALPDPRVIERYITLLTGRNVWIYGPEWFVSRFNVRSETGAPLPWIHPAYPTRQTPPSDPSLWDEWAYAHDPTGKYRPGTAPKGCFTAGWQFSSSGVLSGISAALVDCNIIDPSALPAGPTDEESRMRVIYNDPRYVNRFLIDGVVVHMSPAMYKLYKDAGTPEITEIHEQTLKSLMFQSGITAADLVKP